MSANTTRKQRKSIYRHSINCISNLMLYIVDWGCCLVHARRPLNDFLLSPLDPPFPYLFSCLCSLPNTILSFELLLVSFFACLHSPAVRFSRLSRRNYSFCSFVLPSHRALPSCLCLFARQGKSRQGNVNQGKALPSQSRQCGPSKGRQSKA